MASAIPWVCQLHLQGKRFPHAEEIASKWCILSTKCVDKNELRWTWDQWISWNTNRIIFLNLSDFHCFLVNAMWTTFRDAIGGMSWEDPFDSGWVSANHGQSYLQLGTLRTHLQVYTHCGSILQEEKTRLPIVKRLHTSILWTVKHLSRKLNGFCGLCTFLFTEYILYVRITQGVVRCRIMK